MSDKTNQRLFVCKIGERQAPSVNHLYLDYQAEKYVTTFMYFLCIENKTGPVLVDHGFTSETIARLNVDFQMDAEPQVLLSRIGIKPEDVEKVILTHLHWDHFVAETIFPNATYYVQRKEIEFVTGPLMSYECYRRYMDPKAAEKIVRLNFEGKVVILDGDSEIVPGIEVIHVGGHTPGSQAVVVRIDEDFVIAGDVIPRYRNLERRIPCGIHTDPVEALSAIEKIEKRAGSKDRIFPGHDHTLIEKYPQYAEGIFLLAKHK